jgi:hypothetical protein
MKTLLLLAIIWILCYSVASRRIDTKKMGTLGRIAFFFISPIMHILVLLGFGITGYGKDNWEDFI